MVRGSNTAKRVAWRERLRRFGEIGPVSVAEFCRQEQVSIPSFYAWRKKLTPDNPTAQASQSTSGKTSAAKPAHAQAFVPLRVAASAPTEALEIRLPNGAQLRCPSSLGAAGWLASVVAAAAMAAPADGHQRTLAEERSC